VADLGSRCVSQETGTTAFWTSKCRSITTLRTGDVARAPETLLRSRFAQPRSARVALIGRADWNDCLNLNCFSETPDESFQNHRQPHWPNAESVFIAGMFVHIGPEYVRSRSTKASAEARRARSNRQDGTGRARARWDGEWFLRAFDFFGNKVAVRIAPKARVRS